MRLSAELASGTTMPQNRCEFSCAHVSSCMRSPARVYESESSVMPNVAVPGSPTFAGSRTSVMLRWNGSGPPPSFSTKSSTPPDHDTSRPSTGISGFGNTNVVGTLRPGHRLQPELPREDVHAERARERMIDRPRGDGGVAVALLADLLAGRDDVDAGGHAQHDVARHRVELGALRVRRDRRRTG